MKIEKIKAKSVSYGARRSLSTVSYIVIHYTGNDGDTAQGNGKYFATGNTRSAGAHFFVSQNGDVVESIPMELIAWAVGGNYGGGQYYGKCTNNNSVSIELCDNASKAPSEKQTAAVRELVAYIRKSCKNASTIVRHWDINHKSCLPVEETELLTPNGWRRLIDIQKDDVVCAYKAESDSLVFSDVLDVVKPHSEEVLENRRVVATANHRMYLKANCRNSTRFKEKLWGDVLDGKKQYLIKNGAQLETEGLDLTDDELRLLVWIQGDGHYMKDKNCLYGIEFHLKKERKLVRIKELLDDLGYAYNVSRCKNGSEHIRLYGKQYVKWAETWLRDKTFNYNLLNLSHHQFEVFRSEMVHVDGCKGGTNEFYTSIDPRNLDVVQALCATHGVRTSQQNLGSDFRCCVALNKSNYTVGRGSVGTPVTKRTAIVSCVTVESGYILIRQNGRTFIVGNCPGPYLLNDSNWNKFVKAIGGTAKGTQAGGDIVKRGQANANTFLSKHLPKPHQIDVDGYKGKDTTKQMVKCVQLALDLDKDAGLIIDGIIGPKTKAALESIKKGDKRYLCLAVKILFQCNGKDANLKYSKTFGGGLEKVAGKKKITPSDILALI